MKMTRQSHACALSFILLAAIAPRVRADHVGNLFRPLIADPRENQFRMKWVHFTEDSRYGSDITDPLSEGGVIQDRTGVTWDVAFGETFRTSPRIRRVACDPTSRRKARSALSPWESFQLGIPAGVFADFDRVGGVLINADYQVGGSFDAIWCGSIDPDGELKSFDHPVLTSRTMIYHRSTHLGDEYLSQSNFGRNQETFPDTGGVLAFPPVKRVNLSFEAFRHIFSLEWSPKFLPAYSTLRLYGGGEFKFGKLFTHEPSNFTSPVLQFGTEFHSAGARDSISRTWLSRIVNCVTFRRCDRFITEWIAAADVKVAKPYNFASADNPTGETEKWTPNLWTNVPYGKQFRNYAGSWHAMVGFTRYEPKHRQRGAGGHFISPFDLSFTVDWYQGYSPNGQFLDQRYRYRPTFYVVPSLTLHY